MHFSLTWNPIQKSSHFWMKWQRRVQTLVKKSGSWLREMVVINGCCFSCLASDHVKTSSQWWRVWGEEQGGGAWAPRGEKVCGSERFLSGNSREKDLSPNVTLLPSSTILFSSHSAMSVSDCFCLFPVFVNQIEHFEKCLCATVELACTSLRGQSLTTGG